MKSKNIQCKQNGTYKKEEKRKKKVVKNISQLNVSYFKSREPQEKLPLFFQNATIHLGLVFILLRSHFAFYLFSTLCLGCEAREWFSRYFALDVFASDSRLRFLRLQFHITHPITRTHIIHDSISLNRDLYNLTDYRCIARNVLSYARIGTLFKLVALNALPTKQCYIFDNCLLSGWMIVALWLQHIFFLTKSFIIYDLQYRNLYFSCGWKWWISLHNIFPQCWVRLEINHKGVYKFERKNKYLSRYKCVLFFTIE